jgi:hypothetical protein
MLYAGLDSSRRRPTSTCSKAEEATVDAGTSAPDADGYVA